MLPSAEEVAAAAADVLAAARGHVALAGGSSPRRAYGLAAQGRDDWSGTTLWFGDERCVPPDDEHSNFRMVKTALLDELAAPPEVVRIEGELGAEAAAGAYETELRSRLGNAPRLDLVLLGLGPDAHTASLFPGKPAAQEARRLAAPVPEAGMPPQVPRVTLTLPVLNAARAVVFLVAGADKQQAMARAFGDEPDPASPAARVRPAEGDLLVLCDEAAAAGL